MSGLALQYLHGGVVHYRPGTTLGPRKLADYELVLIIEGHVHYQRGNRDYDIPPGGVILAGPGQAETYHWDPTHLTRHAYLHFLPASDKFDGTPLMKDSHVEAHPDPVVAPMIRHLIECVAAHPEWPATCPPPAICAFLEYLLALFKSHSFHHAKPAFHRLPESVHQALNHMRRVLENNPQESVVLADLAKCAGVTEKHLCRLFQAALAHSPMETFRLLKLQLSVSLLAQSNLAIKEIAHRCGFENPLYFTRCFTRVYGSSPTAVRASLSSGGLPPAHPLPADLGPRIFW